MKFPLTVAIYAAAEISAVTAIYCQNVTVTVSVSARNGIYNLTAPKNDIEVTDFASKATRPGRNYTETVLEGASHETQDIHGM
jgi:hypothetical protein